MQPRFNSISAYEDEISKHQEALKALNKLQFNLMLKNDVTGMDALGAPIKQAEEDIDNLKLEMYEVMGAYERGRKGNQLLQDDKWGGFEPKEDKVTPNMGDMSPTGNAAKPGLKMTNWKPLFAANDTAAHVTGLDDGADSFFGYRPEDYDDKTGGTNSGGGSADFFREQREKKEAAQKGMLHAYGNMGDGLAAEQERKEAEDYKYITEKDFNTQLADYESQLGMREQLANGYSLQLENAVSSGDPNYLLYQHGYNRNLNEAGKLSGQIEALQIEALKGQREWSKKADDYVNKAYDTEEAAALAFADPAVTETGGDHLERAAVVIRTKVPVVDKDGNIIMESKFVLKDSFVGEHDNVIAGVLTSYLESVGDLAQGDTISFVHTHPYCTGHVPNEFSGEKGVTVWDILNYSASEVISGGDFNQFAEYLGDRQVAWLPGVDRIYLASPTEQELYACDKNGPIRDSYNPSKYQVIDTFNSKIYQQYQE